MYGRVTYYKYTKFSEASTVSIHLYPQNGGSTFIRNGSICLSKYTASLVKIKKFWFSPDSCQFTQYNAYSV